MASPKRARESDEEKSDVDSEIGAAPVQGQHNGNAPVHPPKKKYVRGPQHNGSACVFATCKHYGTEVEFIKFTCGKSSKKDTNTHAAKVLR
jgi:hypothetical protein